MQYLTLENVVLPITSASSMRMETQLFNPKPNATRDQRDACALYASLDEVKGSHAYTERKSEYPLRSEEEIE